MKSDNMITDLSQDEARAVGHEIGVDFSIVDIEQHRQGVLVELEHGFRDPQTNITNKDLAMIGEIGWAHLREMPDYYTRLQAMESRAKEVA